MNHRDVVRWIKNPARTDNAAAMATIAATNRGLLWVRGISKSPERLGACLVESPL